MQDGIIKGNGNSRYLKSVAELLTLYPTYEDFAQALMAGNLPIDLNGINAEGWSQQGTALNKAALLKDATAALYGLGTDAVPDDVLAGIRPLITAVETTTGGKATAAIIARAGTGKYGASNPTQLTVPASAKAVVFCVRKDTSTGEVRGWSGTSVSNRVFGNPGNGVEVLDSSDLYLYWKFSGTTFSLWHTTSALTQLNGTGYTYYFLVIG